jgi:hypothetical protein
MKKIKSFTIIGFITLLSITLNAQITLPYYTGFDTPAEKAGWQEFRTGFLSSYSWNSNGALHHDYNVGGNSGDIVVDWYVSPPLNFSSPGKLSMKVMTGGFSTPFSDNCEVWYGTNNPNPSTGNFVLIANLSYMQPQYQWIDTTINISIASDSGFIAFKYKTIGAAWMTYTIDSITARLNPASIKETNSSEKTRVKISPMPFNYQATVYFSSCIRNGELSIYNIFGQKIKTIKNISGQEYKLLRNNLPKGLYFIQLIQDNKIITTNKFEIVD